MTLLLQASTGKPTKRHHLLLDEDVKEGAPTSQSEQGWDHGRDWPGCVACPPQVCQLHVKIFFNPRCFQMEGEPLEECLETTSVLSPSLSGNLIYLQV